jgi:hypothetical protein
MKKFMRNDRGAIALFALLAMMFFLIFIMVAYNNIAMKGKTQVETTTLLRSEYDTGETAAEAINRKVDNTAIDKSEVPNCASEDVSGGNVYAYKDGKICLLK